MPWILIAYLLGLFYFAAHQDKIQDKSKFRSAWIWLTLVPVKNFVFTLFIAGHIKSPRDLPLIEVWSNGLSWLLLGISLFALINALVPPSPKEPQKLNLDDFKVQ